MRSAPDLTTRSRIRDVAIRAFAEQGFAGASVRKIAAEAGVSPALVIHHFGSKAGLRQACDEHVLSTLTALKVQAVRGRLDQTAMATALADADVVLAYFARGFTEGHDHAATLFDGMVALAERTLAEGEAVGAVRTTSDARTRAALLVAWQVGQLVLAEHLGRVLQTRPRSVESLLCLAEMQTELLTEGLYTDERFVHMTADVAALHQEAARE